jgi:hypothetical protein
MGAMMNGDVGIGVTRLKPVRSRPIMFSCKPSPTGSDRDENTRLFNETREALERQTQRLTPQGDRQFA